jgi:hypothetical protein
MEEDVEEAEDTDSVDTGAATAAQTGALHEAAVADTVLGRHTARTAGVTLAGVATAHRAVAAT